MMIRCLTLLGVVGLLAGCNKPKPAVPATDSAAKVAADTTAKAVQQRALKAPATIPSTLEQWEHFDYSTTAVPDSALASMSLADVQRIRAIIFGKHGRIFQDDTLQGWLMSRPWYHADMEFSNARLADGERQNLDVVRDAEASKHTHIEPGDMRFYQNRVITTAMLGDHSPQDWEVLEAEVVANHGYVFNIGRYEFHEDDANRELNEHDLQHYFNERYWYQPKDDFSPSELSAIEKQNLDTIAFAVMKQNKRSVSPGVMHLLTNTPLTDTMLAHVNLADLRLIRNEIYALHGRPFETPWLAEYFGYQPWYKRRKDYTDADLSPIEKANIALIAKREEELHQSLSTRRLGVADVRDLRPDDARRLRNEIYARHGRRFRDPALQRYFAGFSWYHPNESFRDSQLSNIERANAELISQYEHGRFTEG